MANETAWTEDSGVEVVSVAANMTNGQVAGNTAELNNSTNKRVNARATLYVNAFATTPTAETVVELWMTRQDTDGTSDDTAGSSVTSTPATPSNGFASSQGAELVCVFPVAQTTSAQRISRDFSLFGVNRAKFFVRNQTGVTINAGTGTEMTVDIVPYSPGTA